MITLKFETIYTLGNCLVITCGTKTVQFLEDHGIDYRMPYDDISLREDTVVELPLTTYAELHELCQKYNAVLTFDDQDCYIEFLQYE